MVPRTRPCHKMSSYAPSTDEHRQWQGRLSPHICPARTWQREPVVASASKSWSWKLNTALAIRRRCRLPLVHGEGSLTLY